MSPEVLYRLEEVSYAYRGRGLPEPVPALRGLTLGLGEGEYLAVAGPNGSGKTTLALLLAGILRPDSGTVILGGSPPPDDRPFPGVAMVFQDPESSFVAPVLEEDVAFGPENLGLPPREIRRLVDESLAKVGLEGLAHRHPATLSGGQQQLAALAGALACRPRVLILDEATGFLDASHRRRFLRIVSELHGEGMTVVAVTQEAEEMQAAGRLIVLREGSLAWDGPPDDLLLAPGRCRELGVEPDYLAELGRCLAARGLKIPPDRLTIEALEAWLVRRDR
jgi:energy-coupling factor transport system ATP-binding protein